MVVYRTDTVNNSKFTHYRCECGKLGVDVDPAEEEPDIFMDWIMFGA